jgi:hypothetical protein
MIKDISYEFESTKQLWAFLAQQVYLMGLGGDVHRLERVSNTMTRTFQCESVSKLKKVYPNMRVTDDVKYAFDNGTIDSIEVTAVCNARTPEHESLFKVMTRIGEKVYPMVMGVSAKGPVVMTGPGILKHL